MKKHHVRTELSSEAKEYLRFLLEEEKKAVRKNSRYGYEGQKAFELAILKEIEETLDL